MSIESTNSSPFLFSPLILSTPSPVWHFRKSIRCDSKYKVRLYVPLINFSKFCPISYYNTHPSLLDLPYNVPFDFRCTFGTHRNPVPMIRRSPFLVFSVTLLPCFLFGKTKGLEWTTTRKGPFPNSKTRRRLNYSESKDKDTE